MQDPNKTKTLREVEAGYPPDLGQDKCCYCGFDNTSTRVGAGMGDTSRFAHEDCREAWKKGEDARRKNPPVEMTVMVGPWPQPTPPASTTSYFCCGCQQEIFPREQKHPTPDPGRFLCDKCGGCCHYCGNMVAPGNGTMSPDYKWRAHPGCYEGKKPMSAKARVSDIEAQLKLANGTLNDAKATVNDASRKVHQLNQMLEDAKKRAHVEDLENQARQWVDVVFQLLKRKQAQVKSVNFSPLPVCARNDAVEHLDVEITLPDGSTIGFGAHGRNLKEALQKLQSHPFESK